MGVLDWMHLSCVSCVFARMHENAKVCPPSQRGMARPPWYGGSANRFSPRAGGGGGAFRVRSGGGGLRAWCLGCPVRAWSRLLFVWGERGGDGCTLQPSTCLGSRTRQDYHLQPHPRKKGTTRLRSTNGCRNGMSGAWRRALMCGGRHIHGERLENALLTPSCPCVCLFQLVESTGRQVGGSLS